jgi:monoamine oxidase
MKAGAFNVVIVGAGAAGLAALAELDRAGRKVLCVEARDRIGGRVQTLYDPLSPAPLELGAEFIHGRSPEIWDVIRAQGLLASDCAQTAVRVKDGKAQHGADGWEIIDRVMQDMRKAAKKRKDRSFASFLEDSPHAAEAKRLAMSYVEGFNAARGELVSIRALAKEADAADEIDGDESFRFVNGYVSLLRQMIAEVRDLPAKLHLNSIVERVQWSGERASVQFRSALTGQKNTVQAETVIVTVPLGVLQAASISFEPEPEEILHAARSLKFGQVMRVVLRFREAFWEAQEEFACAGFVLSDEPSFPTWWTLLPIHAPVMTGWCAGPHTDHLLGKPRAEIVGTALADLSRIVGLRQDRLNEMLETAYFHDWHEDPFARGAYSYVPVGALGAREALAEPAGKTLCFAGEATEVNGHSATVHGAIASGKRAARRIISKRPSLSQ